MTPIERLQFAAISHTWGSLGGRVALYVLCDPDLYDVVTILVTAQTRAGCIDLALAEMARRRNSRPRLVSITTLAERGGWIAERQVAA